MKVPKRRLYSKALFIIILMIAICYLNPGDTRRHIQSVVNQNCALILTTLPHQDLLVHPSEDLYITKDTKPVDDKDADDKNDNDNEDDNEDDNGDDNEDEDEYDDWEGC